jgi:glucokinase
MLVLGVDVGGTKIAAGLVTPGGRVLDRLTVPTPAASGPAAIIAAVHAAGAELMLRAPMPVTGCGVGAAGVIDPATGRVTSATAALPGWAGTDLRNELQDALGLPVTVLNDVHAHAIAEARRSPRGTSPGMLFLALGTGIGGAVVRHGKVEPGHGGAAGHFGHLPVPAAAGMPCACGKSGHLEAVASGPAILSRYRAATGQADVTDTREVFRRALAGDEAAAACVGGAAEAIGETIGGLLNALDPEIVVMGGGLAYAGPAWFTAIVRAARSSAIPVTQRCPVTLASNGEGAAVLGAALWHLDQGAAAA